MLLYPAFSCLVFGISTHRSKHSQLRAQLTQKVTQQELTLQVTQETR